MHFWIDKRSQACGFNGRYQVPPSLSGYGRNLPRCSSFYPKPMVTPVHRFQSIESVANNSIRYARSPGYHPRLQCPPSVHYNGSSSNVRIPQVGRSVEMMSSGGSHHTTTPRHNITRSSTKLKCGVWIFFVLATFILASFFHGIIIGMETLIFCSLLVIAIVLGGLIALCEKLLSHSTSSSPAREATNIAQAPEQVIEETNRSNSNETTNVTISTNQVISNTDPSELPPPPYHIAIMLAPQNDMETIQVIRDSPPPSYEKAVT